MIRRSDLQHEATRAAHADEMVPRSAGEVDQAHPPLRMVRFKSGYDNHIVCRDWDGTTDGDVDVKAALGVHLQKQLVGTGYTYSNFQTRVRDSDGRAEFINPAYVVDQVLFLVQCNATNVEVEITPASGETPAVTEDLVYMELIPPRFWSKAC